MNVSPVAKEVRDFCFLQICSYYSIAQSFRICESELRKKIKRLSQDFAVNDEGNTNSFVYNDKMLVL